MGARDREKRAKVLRKKTKLRNGLKKSGSLVQKQIYITKELADWLEDDRARAEAAFREAHGDHHDLSWSRHVTEILYQHFKASQKNNPKKGQSK